MSVIGAALITFFGLTFLATHLSRQTRRRLVGYAGWLDLAVHCVVIFAFFGTSTLGLLQAELCAIFFTCFVRGYRYLFGYERLTSRGWMPYAGLLRTRD
ncbi:MAG: hypothetical protein Q4G62_07165 [Pseudomonadota bacterium]|nr:hypothetical protein [Pseudomonadota bacterium]